MKGRNTTLPERRFADMLCSRVGCVACRKDGLINFYCSVHHIDGRVKPHAHWYILPLCGGHHQGDGRAPGLTSLHPWAAQFTAKYGTEDALLAFCLDVLAKEGVSIPFGALEFVTTRGIWTAPLSMVDPVRRIEI